jgi:hypothetical protein
MRARRSAFRLATNEKRDTTIATLARSADITRRMMPALERYCEDQLGYPMEATPQ